MRRSHAPWLAIAMAVGLHGLGTWWLGAGGWSTRTSGAVVDARGGPVEARAGRVLKVRVSAAEAPALDAPGAGPLSPEASMDAAQQPASEGPVNPAVVAQLTPDQATLAERYVQADQLDRAPSPEPGWILDEDAFSEVGSARMVLRLWVSAQGHIDRVDVLRAEPAGAWVDRAIRPLPETRMRPGERAGQAVASSIVVELFADLETFR